jgi:glycosyltransferase involved in cell wall biosynthesis
MAYNEAANLPRWLRHYSAQLGPENCLVVDHGSDDGSTEALRHPVGRLGLSRHRPFNEHPRAAFVSGLVSALLEYYDGVLYTDADEYVVADPRRHASLADLFASRQWPNFTALGFDVVHLVEDEPELDPERGLLEQRPHVLFNQAMCKTVLVRAPIRWGGGFHTSNRPPRFADLYLFHAKTADIELRRARTALTRTIAMAPEAGDRQDVHWRLSDEEVLERARRYGAFEVADWDDEWKDRLVADLSARSQHEHVGEGGTISRHSFAGQTSVPLGRTLFRLPEELRGVV